MTEAPDDVPTADDGAAGTGSAPVSAAVPEAADVRRLEEQLRFALADLDNLRKRVDRTVARERVAERARSAKLWLPVLDNLDRALEHAAPEPSAISDGVQTIRTDALAAMAELGFPLIDALGERFDPARHEALGTIEVAGEPPGVVVAVVRNGYGGEPVLRPAGVMVSRGGS